MSFTKLNRIHRQCPQARFDGTPRFGIGARRFLDPMLRKGWEKNLAWGKREIEKQEKAAETTA